MKLYLKMYSTYNAVVVAGTEQNKIFAMHSSSASNGNYEKQNIDFISVFARSAASKCVQETKLIHRNSYLESVGWLWLYCLGRRKAKATLTGKVPLYGKVPIPFP